MTSGEGHNSIAKVLSAQFAKMDIQSEIVDMFRNDGWEYQFNKLGYLWACRLAACCSYTSDDGIVSSRMRATANMVLCR